MLLANASGKCDSEGSNQQYFRRAAHPGVDVAVAAEMGKVALPDPTYVLPHSVQAKALLDRAVAVSIWSQKQSVAGAVAEIKPAMLKLFTNAGPG